MVELVRCEEWLRCSGRVCSEEWPLYGQQGTGRSCHSRPETNPGHSNMNTPPLLCHSQPGFPRYQHSRNPVLKMGTKITVSIMVALNFQFHSLLPSSYMCLRERFKGVRVIRLRKYYFTCAIKKNRYSGERRQALDSNYQCFYLKLEMVMLF